MPLREDDSRDALREALSSMHEDDSIGDFEEFENNIPTEESDDAMVQNIANVGGDAAFVRFWKVATLITILATAAAVTTTAYLFLKNDDEEGFKNQVSSSIGVLHFRRVELPPQYLFFTFL